ncbi:MAG: type II secretion system F family protein [Rhizobiaceae bacterium]
MDITIIALTGLVILVVATVGYALMYKSISDTKKSGQRIKDMQVDRTTKNKNQAKRVDDKQKRKTRENTMKNVAAQRSSGKKAASPPLNIRIVQAGMTMSMKKFYTIGVIVSIFCFLLALTLGGLPWYIAIGVGFVAGFGMPYWFVNFKRNRRFRAFTLAFPNAIDVIVRGIRSGLPLNDCLRIIANDAAEPVKGEFRKLIEATQMGIPVPDACDRLYESIPTSEANFFAIVIAIQSSAGGNLSEALGNLSKVLRERRKMADKIQAFSTEAKASAMIIGSLPFVVAALVSISTPGYLNPLFDDPTGQKILLGCAGSMGAGIGVMKKMISFKF